jgi:hypothetical protein
MSEVREYDHMRIEEFALYSTTTFKDHPHRENGQQTFPHVSRALANLVAGTYDLTIFEPMERAEFLYGLWKMYEALEKIGWIEHTSDWDWYVQIELVDGSVYGDDSRNGKAIDDPEYQDTTYCDDFSCDWNDETFHLYDDPVLKYEALTITLTTMEPELDHEVITKHRVGDLKSITISQR